MTTDGRLRLLGLLVGWARGIEALDGQIPLLDF